MKIPQGVRKRSWLDNESVLEVGFVERYPVLFILSINYLISGNYDIIEKRYKSVEHTFVSKPPNC